MTDVSQKYAAFLDLAGVKCLVVGAGQVAERKVFGLLEGQAHVTVIGPVTTSQIDTWAKTGQIELHKREFDLGDLKSVRVVIAAAGKRCVNQKIYEAASAAGILVNVVDEPELCSFFVPSVIRRGDLQIAISTGGASPAFARHLREKLEVQFGPEYADYLQVIKEFRRRVKAHAGSPELLKAACDRLFASDTLERIRSGQHVDVESLVQRYAV